LLLNAFICDDNNVEIEDIYDKIINIAKFCDIEIMEQYISKVLELVKNKFGENHEKVAATYEKYSEILTHIGNKYQESKELYLKATEIKKKVFGEMSIEVAQSYKALIDKSDWEKDKESIIKYYERMIHIKKNVLGEKQSEIGDDYFEFAKLLKVKGKIKESIDYYFKAINFFKINYGEDCLKLGEIYESLCFYYFDLEKYKEVDVYEKKSTEIRLKNISVEKLNISHFYEYLAHNFRCKGNGEKVLEYLEKIVEIKRKFFPAISEEYLYSLSCLMNFLVEIDKLDKAIKTCEQEVTILKQFLSDKNPDIAKLWDTLAFICDKKSLKSYANNFFNNGNNQRINALGPNIRSLSELYEFLHKQNRKKGFYKASIYYGTKAIENKEKEFEELHPSLSTLYSSVSHSYAYEKNFEKALEYKIKEMKSIKRLGEYNSQLADIYNSLGSLYEIVSNSEKAIEYYEKEIEVIIKANGENNAKIVFLYNNLAKFCTKLENYKKASEFGSKTVDIISKSLGEEYLNNHEVFSELAEECIANFRFDKAIEFYNKFIDLCKKTHNEDSNEVFETYRNLALSFGYNNDIENANKYFEVYLQATPENESNNITLSNFYNEFGIMYASNGLNKEASDLFKKSFNLRIAACGSDNEQLAKSFIILGTQYEILKKYNDSLECLNIANEIKKESSLQNLKLHSEMLNCMGKVHYGLHDYELSCKYFLKALQTYDTNGLLSLTNTENSIETFQSNLGRGFAFFELKQFEKSYECFEYAMNRFSKKWPIHMHFLAKDAKSKMKETEEILYQMKLKENPSQVCPKNYNA